MTYAQYREAQRKLSGVWGDREARERIGERLTGCGLMALTAANDVPPEGSFGRQSLS